MSKEQFGKYLKQKRKENGFTQEIAAERLEQSINTIQYWENGKHTPKPEMFKKISSLYNIPYNTFIDKYAESLKEEDKPQENKYPFLPDYLINFSLTELETQFLFTPNPYTEQFLLFYEKFKKIPSQTLTCIRHIIKANNLHTFNINQLEPHDILKIIDATYDLDNVNNCYDTIKNKIPYVTYIKPCENYKGTAQAFLINNIDEKDKRLCFGTMDGRHNYWTITPEELAHSEWEYYIYNHTNPKRPFGEEFLLEDNNIILSEFPTELFTFYQKEIEITTTKYQIENPYKRTVKLLTTTYKGKLLEEFLKTYHYENIRYTKKDTKYLEPLVKQTVTAYGNCTKKEKNDYLFRNIIIHNNTYDYMWFYDIKDELTVGNLYEIEGEIIQYNINKNTKQFFQFPINQKENQTYYFHDGQVHILHEIENEIGNIDFTIQPTKFTQL